ncbi:hypothetical protein ABT263_33140 [Kitasatospora sp. NPDC001603]|uniref:hypothetical protein n=1 Tax=Kitasatospora sp. NPDC001603 TaxID=3154388 RepID=UPI00331C4D84
MTFPVSRRLARRLLAVLLAPLVILALRDDEPPAFLGILFGSWLALLLPDMWTLLFHRAAGVRLTVVRYGRGRKLVSTTVVGVPVEIGLVPAAELTIVYEITPTPWLRPRLWLHSAALLTVQLGLGALLAAYPQAFTRDLGISLLVTTVVANLRYHAGPLAPLWAALGLTLRHDLIEHQLRHPALTRAERQMIRGRIGEARRQLDSLPASTRVSATEVGVLLAEGRYEQADAGARELLQSHEGACRASGYQLLAAAAVAAGEAGELPQREVRHRVALALIGLHGDGSQPEPNWTHKYAQTAADAELLDGRPELAARLAQRWSVSASSPFWRSDACCTLAAALTALGRHDDARAALARARRQCPELARAVRLEALLNAAQRDTTPPLSGARVGS